MKFIELYNSSESRVNISELTIVITKDGVDKKVKMTGCMEPKSYRVLYPNTQTLSALDVDATSEQVALDDLKDAGAYTIRLYAPDNTIIHGVSVPDMTEKVGVSAARNATPEKSGTDDVLVPHDSIEVTFKPDGEASPLNYYSPGVANDLGFPLG